MAFSPDGRYIYVGNCADEDFSILKVDRHRPSPIPASGSRWRPSGIGAGGPRQPLPRCMVHVPAHAVMRRVSFPPTAPARTAPSTLRVRTGFRSTGFHHAGRGARHRERHRPLCRRCCPEHRDLVGCRPARVAVAVLAVPGPGVLPCVAFTASSSNLWPPPL